MKFQDPRDVIERGVPWLALAVSILGFALGGVRGHDLDDATIRERIARLEAKVEYIQNATNRLLDAFAISRPENNDRKPPR